LIPPRLFFLMAYLLVILLFFIGNQTGHTLIYPPITWWIVLLTLYLAALFISIPGYLYSSKMFMAFLHVPALMWSLLKAVFKMKPGRKEFIHTPKTNVENHSVGND
jgi:hypothetical protein